MLSIVAIVIKIFTDFSLNSGKLRRFGGLSSSKARWFNLIRSDHTKLAMFFGAVVWDPWLIIAQIVCMQCLYYLTLGLVLAILVGTRVSKITLFYIFDFAAVSVNSVTGWCVIASFILASLAGAGYLVYLIERAKKCVDFSATVYIIHLIICVSFSGWPSSFTWWIVNIAGLAVMALLGEYLCVRRELREIPITRYRPIV